MSIRPLDFQILIPKSQEVSKIQNEIAEKNGIMQQAQLTTFKNQTENKMKQVQKKDKAWNVSITEKQEKENGSENRKRKKGDNPNEGDSQHSSNTLHGEKMRSGSIDIRI